MKAKQDAVKPKEAGIVGPGGAAVVKAEAKRDAVKHKAPAAAVKAKK